MGSVSGSTIGNPPCSYIPEAYNRNYPIYSFDELETITFHCPSRIQIPDGEPSQASITSGLGTEVEPLGERFRVYPLKYEDAYPDLLIIVNFTMLNISSNAIVDLTRRSVHVMAGLTNNSRNVIDKTVPTTIIPGVNLIGAVNTIIYRRFKKTTMSTFGLLDVSYNFLTVKRHFH